MADGFWLTAPREGFAAACMARFETNFEDSPVFVVRSEYIKAHGASSHELHQTLAAPKPPSQQRLRAVKHVGHQMSAKAMQSGSLLESRG